MRKRIKHPATFKAKVALEAVTNNHTANEIASQNQIAPSLVCEWKQELIKNAHSVFERDKKIPLTEDYEKQVALLHQK